MKILAQDLAQYPKIIKVKRLCSEWKRVLEYLLFLKYLKGDKVKSMIINSITVLNVAGFTFSASYLYL